VAVDRALRDAGLLGDRSEGQLVPGVDDGMDALEDAFTDQRRPGFLQWY
jgi:hypothetical protein